MNRLISLDVLIVYSEGAAKSANSSPTTTSPFSPRSNCAHYNLAYAYFLEICAKHCLSAGFCTSNDVTDSGRCKSFWTYNDGSWKKELHSASSKLIFDKFTPKTKKQQQLRDLLFSSTNVKAFNDQYLFDLFLNKQKTYEMFKEFSIPSVQISSKKKTDIIMAMQNLKQKMKEHNHQDDFSDDYILKDQFGAGGSNIYKITRNKAQKIYELMQCHKNISFILQPFLKFDKGIFFNNAFQPTDIRLIFLGGKLIQQYFRMAKPKNFLCNEHKGGTLMYVTKGDIPANVTVTAQKIFHLLQKRRSLFALDFIISNNANIYLLEGNTGPGLDWNLSQKKNEIMAKQFIRLIVKELSRRSILARPPALKPELLEILNPPISPLQFAVA